VLLEMSPERVAAAARAWAEEYCDFATGKKTGIKVGRKPEGGTCATAVSKEYKKAREVTL